MHICICCSSTGHRDKLLHFLTLLLSFSGSYSGFGLKIKKFSITGVSGKNSSVASSALSLWPIRTGVS